MCFFLETVAWEYSSRQNARHFAYDIFKRGWFNGEVWVGIKISQKNVANSLVNNCLAWANVLAPSSRQTIIWTNDGLFNWRIYMYVSLVLNGSLYAYALLMYAKT